VDVDVVSWRELAAQSEVSDQELTTRSGVLASRELTPSHGMGGDGVASSCLLRALRPSPSTSRWPAASMGERKRRRAQAERIDRK
jgi:hypothetical protein